MGKANVSTEKIWELLSSKLRQFFRRHVNEESLAEDLLQETFIRIHNGIHSLKDEERASSWVFQIARNTLADHFRQKKPEVEFQEKIEIPLEEESGGNLNHEVAEWLPEILKTLPKTYREAVELFELHKIPQQEIAHRLGLSLSGAKSRVQRGREKLKDLILQCCHLDFDRRGNVIGYRRLPDHCDCCVDGCQSEP